MSAEGRPILADYVRAGWFLVPIPLGSKGPTTARWNTREMCIADPDIAEWLDGNVGLAHAYSGTCAVDVDNIEKSREWLAARGVNLDTLLNAPDAVRIVSRPGRAKLLYRIPQPMQSFNLGGLELRCAASSGLTVQDVLPPSIHPDTGEPYTWAYGSAVSHWSQLPLIPADLFNLWTALIPATAAKPARASTRKALKANPGLASTLAGLDPDAPYDQWLAVGMALHHETEGRPDGLALWNEWSATGQKYKGIGDLETHWRSFKLDHARPITLASLRTETAADPMEFPDLSAEPGTPTVSAPRPPLDPAAKARGLEALRSVRRTKSGTIEARMSNVVAVLGVPQVCGYDLSLDTFNDVVMVSPENKGEWRPLTDTDYTNLRVWLETAGNCDPIPHEMIRHGVALVAERNQMDTAKIWLESLAWDGRERIESFCPDYFGTANTRYERNVGLYLWTALAGRVMEPGCQADMVPVLIGRQGIGKSRGVQALVPSPEHYVEVRLDEADDVIARKCRGVLVGELAEMRGLRAAEIERVKAFITRTHERWVPKYKEFATNYPRRFLIVGTTNDEEFLPTDTEHRRWLPMHSLGVNVPAIKEDRDQLWAEGLARWQVEGITWRGMDELAKDARAAASGEDGWEGDIVTWLMEGQAPHVKMHDVLTQAIGLDARTYTRSHELRCARILRSLGYARTVVREAGRTVKVWSRPA